MTLVTVVAEITNPFGMTHTEIWLVEFEEPDEAPPTVRCRYVWGTDEFPVRCERVR